MKKIFCLLIFSCMIQLSWSQIDEAYYEVTVKGFINVPGICNVPRGIEKITVFYDNGSEDVILDVLVNNDTWEAKQKFTNKEIDKIEVVALANSGFPNCFDTRLEDEILVNSSTCYYEKREEYDGRNFGSYEVFVKPVITLRPRIPNNIGSNEFLEIGPLAGGVDNSVYTWEYALDNGPFNAFPNTYQNRSVLQIKGSDIPGVSPSFNGKKIDVRVNTGCSQSQYSNPIRYEYRVSAPLFTIIGATRPTCYNTKDATVTIRFERDLVSGETVSGQVKDLDIIEDVVNGVNQYKTIKNINSVGISASRTLVVDQLPAGNLRFIFGSSIGGIPLFSDGNDYIKDRRIDPRTPVRFVGSPAIRITDVFCKGGSDGRLSFTATGGIGGYKYFIRKVGDSWPTVGTPFSSGNTHTERGLSEGTYQIRIQDQNNCFAEYQSGANIGDEIVLNARVEEPLTALQVEIDKDASLNPTGFFMNNGKIVAKVSGGTIKPDNTYNYVWKNAADVTLTTIDRQFVSGQGFFITLRDVPQGEYYLTVEDANFSSAETGNEDNCTVVDVFHELIAPPRLEVTFEESKSISCNNTNTNSDPFSDGELIAHAKGGVELGPLDNGGLPYYYTWKKQDEITGLWETLSVTDSIASDLSTGNYAVNIRDANNIILADYVNNVPVLERDEEYFLQDPPLLEISFDKKDVFCFGGEDGSIDITITGGTPFKDVGKEPYTIQWSNGDTTEDIAELLPDFYRVSVTDSLGCRAFEVIEIRQPDPIEFDFVDFKNPSGFEFTDGWIKAEVKKGTPFPDGSYTFEWRDMDGRLLNSQVTTLVNTTEEKFELTLNGIGDGLYFLTIKDANFDEATQKEGCTIVNQRFGIQEPDPLEVDIEESNPISCNNTNVYGNPSSDGELIAHAKGGIRFTSGLPYKYTWKKQQADASWLILTDQTDSIAINLDVGKYAVNIEDQNGVILAEYENNIVVRETDSIYDLKQPPLLRVSFNKQNAYCHAGSDGWAEAMPEGGTPPYTYAWSTGEDTQRINNLEKGIYEVIITDDRGCEVVDTIEIEEPVAPVSISYPSYNRPSSIGANDSWIISEVKGGTPFDDQSYSYEWQNENGDVLNAQTVTSVTTSGVYQIRLNTITAGTYYLTVRDKNHEIATTKSGCTVVESEFVIHEPIESIIEVFSPISCNQDNEFLDPSSDGELVAHVRGGVPFSTGLPYRYTWKKQQTDGSWQVLTSQTDSIARGLDDGRYAFNAEDQLGTVMGIYESDLLIETIDSTFVFVEPELLEVSLSSVPISCAKGNDGSATVDITGGTPPYFIEWSNGTTSQQATDLIAGKYVVFVTDTRGCRATGTVTIDQPGGLDIQVLSQINPTCFQGNDGNIEVQVSGGTPPYQYSWDNGNATTRIDNLVARTYRFQIQDAENCIAFTDVTLTDPDPVPVDLGENRTICGDQSLELDVSIDDPGAIYLWQSDNGFSSIESLVSLSQAGRYSITITNSLGCIGYDEVDIIVSEDPIDADFLLLSQAFTGKEVTLVNVSVPKGEEVIWTVPENEGIQVVEDNKDRLKVIFETPGAYVFNLRTYQGDCYQDYEKTIIVEEPSGLADIGDAKSPFIEEYLLYPNPSDGKFTVKISLSEVAPIALRMFNLTDNRIELEQRNEGQKDYLIPIEMFQATGAYIMVLETPKGDAIRKIIFE